MLKKKSSKGGSKVTINCLAFADNLDMIIFGTVLGKIGVLDSSTMSFIGIFDAHTTEIANLYYNKKEYQLISVSNIGDISLWDAQKMEVQQ